MSKDASAQDGAPADIEGGAEQTRLYMRETACGTWIVGEDGGRRGGSFFTRKAALTFIRREFGPDAQFVATYVVHKQAA